MNHMRSKGQILIQVVIYGAIAVLFVGVLVTWAGINIRASRQAHYREQAVQIAEAGIDYYRWHLAHAPTDYQDGTGVPGPYAHDFRDKDGNVIGHFTLEITPPIIGSTIVGVKSTGETDAAPGITRSIETRLAKPSFAKYAWVLNSFVFFGSAAEVFGPVHSNDGLRFDGIAHNIVTSARDQFNDPDHSGGNEFGVHTHDAPTDPLPPAAVPTRTDIFEAGRMFPETTVDFNGVLGDLSLIKSVAQAGTNGSRYFDNTHQGRHIILKTDDTFDIRTVQSFVASTNEINNYSGGWQTYAIPNEGGIFVEGHVWLEGAVNGRRTTIVAANLLSSSLKNIYIGKDIRYTNYDCTDILGLIGQKDVEIIKSSETDLKIDGALLAQSGRVGRANYGTSDIKSVITVYGALATNLRYGFAWTNGTQNWGYITRNLYYDNNLLYCPPPYFPTSTQYEMDLWEEK